MSVVGGNTINHNLAFAGQALTFEAHNFVARLNTSGVNIPFGRGVVTDTTVTTENAIRLPVVGDVDAAAFNGVTFYELNRAYSDGEVFGAQDGRSVSVLTMGEIFVFANVPVVKDDPVFLITEDTADATAAGNFTNIASAGTVTSLLIPNAKFTSAAAAGVLVKIAFTIGG